MMDIEVYWLGFISLTLFLTILSLRELYFITHYPKGHPEKGMHIFNALMLAVFAVVIIFAGTYVDIGRKTLEQMIMVPSSAHYAIERNQLAHSDTWIYSTLDSATRVKSFYKSMSSEKHIPMNQDSVDDNHMEFDTKDGKLFLTIQTEGEHTILYFSKRGTVQMVTISKEGLHSQ